MVDGATSSEALHVAPLSAVLSAHGQYREIPCFFCRSWWEERLVGVALRQDVNHLGSLCPRCLSYTPRQNATWIREYAEAMHQALMALNTALSHKATMPGSVDEFRAATLQIVQTTAHIQQVSALLRRGTRDLKYAFKRNRTILGKTRPCVVESDPFGSIMTQELDRLDKLMELGPVLLKLPAWQTGIDDLMQAERDHLADAFDVDSAKIAIAIGKRYQAFMLQGA